MVITLLKVFFSSMRTNFKTNYIEIFFLFHVDTLMFFFSNLLFLIHIKFSNNQNKNQNFRLNLNRTKFYKISKSKFPLETYINPINSI